MTTMVRVAERAGELADRLGRYIQHRLSLAEPAEICGLVQIPGGASRETWSFDAAWEDEEGRHTWPLIVRRDPVAGLLETDRDREFAVYRALQGSSIPVPPVYWLERDSAWLERPFFIMGRVPGIATPDAVLKGEFGSPEVIGHEMARILADIHMFDWTKHDLEALGPPPAPNECASREVEHWQRIYERESFEPRPILDAAFRWLRAHPPTAERISLVHGDYRTGNYLVTHDGITAVLDWEMAHLGDPMEDLGWTCMRFWRWARDDRVGGVLTREQFFHRYEEAGGPRVDLDSVHYWELLGNLKMAIICITGARSFVEKRAVNATLAMVGRAVAPLELELLDMMGL
ncbi:MAG TPA: phosphotransferase family protein [Dehalococcoidia bacterium]|nr:phosphotransferase family protein [Dehalococcoidia bacterium]